MSDTLTGFPHLVVTLLVDEDRPFDEVSALGGELGRVALARLEAEYAAALPPDDRAVFEGKERRHGDSDRLRRLFEERTGKTPMDRLGELMDAAADAYLRDRRLPNPASLT